MNKLTTAKCNRCGGSATGDSFEEAKLLINHAVGLSRNIPCGDDRNCTIEVKSNSPKPAPAPATQPKSEPQPPEKPISKKQKSKE